MKDPPDRLRTWQASCSASLNHSTRKRRRQSVLSVLMVPRIRWTAWPRGRCLPYAECMASTFTCQQASRRYPWLLITHEASLDRWRCSASLLPLPVSASRCSLLGGCWRHASSYLTRLTSRATNISQTGEIFANALFRCAITSLPPYGVPGVPLLGCLPC